MLFVLPECRTFYYLFYEGHFHNSIVAPFPIVLNENVLYRFTCLALNALMVGEQMEAKDHRCAARLEAMRMKIIFCWQFH